MLVQRQALADHLEHGLAPLLGHAAARRRPRGSRRCRPSRRPSDSASQRASRAGSSLLPGSYAGVMTTSPATRSGRRKRQPQQRVGAHRRARRARPARRRGRRAPPRGRGRAPRSRTRPGSRRRRGASVAARVVGDHPVAGALQRRRAHHHVAPGRGQPVEQRRPPVPRRRRRRARRDAVALDHRTRPRVSAVYTIAPAAHGVATIKASWTSPRATSKPPSSSARARSRSSSTSGPSGAARAASSGPVIERAVAARAGQGRAGQARRRRQPGPRAAPSGSRASRPSRRSATARSSSEFVGAQPPAAVERFLDSLVPSEADELVAARRRGVAAPRRRARAVARRRRRAAGPDPARAAARTDDALALLGEVPGSFAADGLAARIALEQAGARRRPQEAFAALDAGDQRARARPADRRAADADGARDDIRRVVVGILDELGVDNPLARESRRRLAAALY